MKYLIIPILLSVVLWASAQNDTTHHLVKDSTNKIIEDLFKKFINDNHIPCFVGGYQLFSTKKYVLIFSPPNITRIPKINYIFE